MVENLVTYIQLSDIASSVKSSDTLQTYQSIRQGEHQIKNKHRGRRKEHGKKEKEGKKKKREKGRKKAEENKGKRKFERKN